MAMFLVSKIDMLCLATLVLTGYERSLLFCQSSYRLYERKELLRKKYAD